MFNREQMTVGDWWLYWFLMAIPLVNIIVFLVILLSSSVNRTLKNHLIAAILPFVIFIVIIFGTGFLAVFLEMLQSS